MREGRRILVEKKKDTENIDSLVRTTQLQTAILGMKPGPVEPTYDNRTLGTISYPHNLLFIS